MILIPSQIHFTQTQKISHSILTSISKRSLAVLINLSPLIRDGIINIFLKKTLTLPSTVPFYLPSPLTNGNQSYHNSLTVKLLDPLESVMKCLNIWVNICRKLFGDSSVPVYNCPIFPTPGVLPRYILFQNLQIGTVTYIRLDLSRCWKQFAKPWSKLL